MMRRVPIFIAVGQLADLFGKQGARSATAVLAQQAFVLARRRHPPAEALRSFSSTLPRLVLRKNWRHPPAFALVLR